MEGFSIGELARRAEVTRRTIRYYVEIGLLPPPEGAGRASVYGPEHVDRLEAIRTLQVHRLSLDEIRDQLSTTRLHRPVVPPDERRRAHRVVLQVPDAPQESAADYLATLQRRLPFSPRVQNPPSALASTTAASQTLYDAEPWTRIVLTPDVELHVRRRTTRTDHRLARLVKELRRILAEEETQ